MIHSPNDNPGIEAVEVAIAQRHWGGIGAGWGEKLVNVYRRVDDEGIGVC